MFVLLVTRKQWTSLGIIQLSAPRKGSNCFFDFCSAAAWGPVKEKPFLLPGSSERPADILIPNYSAGKDLAVDFAVTCPLQSAYLHEAANTSLYACNKYAEDIKLAKFQNRVQLEGLDYLPFVFESFGGLSMDTESFISKLATSINLSLIHI